MFTHRLNPPRNGSVAVVVIAIAATFLLAPPLMAHQGHERAAEESAPALEVVVESTEHDHAAHAPDQHEAVDKAASPQAEGGHDHNAHEHGDAQNPVMHLIGWLGKFHPPSVNFPIALTVAALIAEVLFMITRLPLFDHAGRFTVWFAILGTIGAVVLGWFFGGFKLVDNEWLMTTHRWVGTAAGVWAIVLAGFARNVWSQPRDSQPPSRRGYRVALVVATLLVSANGFFGGSLLYGIGHYAW